MSFAGAQGLVTEDLDKEDWIGRQSVILRSTISASILALDAQVRAVTNLMFVTAKALDKEHLARSP